MSILDSAPIAHYFSTEHSIFRAALREFISQEVTPHVVAWDEAGEVPRSLYQRFANIGVLGLGYPEEYGGTPTDTFYQIILAEELARCGCGGVQAAICSHTIALPPILAVGSEELKRRVVPHVIRGEKIAALAITEPSGGSDVARLRTTAIRDGDSYVVNGEKTFITSGYRADFFTTAVRTDPSVAGAGGISLLLIEGDTAGLSRTVLKKMGWWCSDTAHLNFDNCRVPIGNLIGEENAGFKVAMRNFNSERLFIAALSYGYAQACFDEAVVWAQSRQTFGQTLSNRQVIRHKLVDMAARIEAVRCMVYELAYRLEHRSIDSAQLIARICLVKVMAGQAMQFCADQAVQILGGAGYMRGSLSERVYREVKVMMIGGGTEEIMKDLAARQFGI